MSQREIRHLELLSVQQLAEHLKSHSKALKRATEYLKLLCPCPDAEAYGHTNSACPIRVVLDIASGMEAPDAPR
jgi:hypothetical protein